MPVQEQASQRNYLLPSGETFTETFLAPAGVRTFVATVPQARTVQGSTFPLSWKVPYFQDLGGPRRRTVWSIQSFQTSFKVAAMNGTSAIQKTTTPVKVTVALELLVGNTVVAITYVRIKVPEFVSTKEEAQEFYRVLEELKLYTLELFSPVTVYGGEAVSFRLKLEEGYILPNSRVSEVFRLFFEEMKVSLVFEQKFQRRRNAS